MLSDTRTSNGNLLDKYDLTIDMLDYKHIESSGDVRQLVRILRVLRSGEEGDYPQLMEFCENRIRTLEPTHRILRRSDNLWTRAQLGSDRWEEMRADLDDWLGDVTETDRDLQQCDVVPTLPPIRLTESAAAPILDPVPNGERRIKSNDYRAWDAYDADSEAQKVEDEPKTVTERVNAISEHVQADALSEAERRLVSQREKDKGNDAYRSGDMREALVYFTRSLSLTTSATALNNRAQVQLQLKRFEECLADCQLVLAIEPGNVKASLRAASALCELGRWRAAHEHLERLRDAGVESSVATTLRAKVERNLELPQTPMITELP